MNAAHVSGAGVGVALGALLVSLLNQYAGTHLTTADGALIGGAMGAAGLGIAHAVWNIGLVPVFDRILHGPPKQAAPVVNVPAPPA